MKKSAFTAVLVILLLAFTGCRQEVKLSEEKESKQEDVIEVFSPSFEVHSVDQETEAKISGISWRDGSPISMNDLCYVRVAYWGFDDKGHEGELIVNKAVAQEVSDIFKELYERKFPIEKIRLIDEYAADDSKSMADNNTSAFNFREVAGKPGKLSKHSYGLAIDINPVQNPYIYKAEISPASGIAYINRADIRKGMIVKEDDCYKAFISRGWQWGGNWKYEKDYQHFQKNVEPE